MDLRFRKGVKSVVILEKSPVGEVMATVLHSTKKKKKGSRLLKPAEKLARKMAHANATYAEEYEKQHNKSNRKSRDGWLIDLGKNTFVSARRANKVAYKK
jgi:hypothetical protein